MYQYLNNKLIPLGNYSRLCVLEHMAILEGFRNICSVFARTSRHVYLIANKLLSVVRYTLWKDHHTYILAQNFIVNIFFLSNVWFPFDCFRTEEYDRNAGERIQNANRSKVQPPMSLSLRAVREKDDDVVRRCQNRVRFSSAARKNKEARSSGRDNKSSEKAEEWHVEQPSALGYHRRVDQSSIGFNGRLVDRCLE